MDNPQIGIQVIVCLGIVALYIFYSVSKFIRNSNRDEISDSPYMKLNEGKKFPLNSASKAIPMSKITSDTVFKPSEF